MIKSGIYRILNNANGKLYVGSAVNFNRRFCRHKRLLNANEHPNQYLQNAWLKYGESGFNFAILQHVENKADLIANEQNWLDWFKCYDRKIGYNICRVANNRTGVLHSAETRAKLSASNKGRVKSPEWQAKITAAVTGKKRNPEVGKAHSERLKGRKLSDETRANMAKGQTGRRHSLESRLARSVILKGKPFNNPKKDPKHSEETKRKISEARIKYLARTKENQANA